ncbi:MAG: MRP family ATP-binding protein [Proteobacteria bacterium]|nr:MRP family ATP-binding protein [Pseudomonadota bacterium]
MPAPIDEQQVKALLSKVPYPGFSRDIVSFGVVRGVTLGDEISVQLVIATNDTGVAAELRSRVVEALAQLPGKPLVKVLVDVQAPVQSGAQGPVSIPGVRHVIAVASGKGGVGKSTVSANLAAALAAKGLKVGLCDCDLYGPSMALMFGATERPMADEEGRILPVERHGVKLMSMGLLLEEDSPAVLRGPMVTRYTQQFLRNVLWNDGGDLDILILDLPPGTGDIQLTIVQTVPLAGAVIVTTPQEVALIDARKAVSMFEKTNVPILGILENMSGFVAPDGSRHEIFGSGGGEREAARLGVPFLGALPLDPALRIAADAGMPLVLTNQDSPTVVVIREVAANLASLVC